MVEKFYGEASEMVEKEYQSARKKYRRRKLCDIDDGEELWNYLEDSNDGVSFEVSIKHQHVFVCICELFLKFKNKNIFRRI